jgi:hypothetical protein
MTRYVLLPLLLMFLLIGSSVASQEVGGIDPEALIERILAADKEQREQIHDITFDAEYIERESEGDDGFKEKVRLIKKVYLKYLEDTCLYAEEYLEYYKDGELQSENDLRNEEKDRREKKIKRKGRDISYPILRPFSAERRSLYDLQYLGVADERINDLVCHHFQVRALEEADSLINGEFYFEAETFHLVRTDFQPAKLVKKTMFKLKEFSASLLFEPTHDGLWLPRQFDVQGKGKAAFFFGVSFAGSEYYRNPQVNTDLDDSLFEVTDDQ